MFLAHIEQVTIVRAIGAVVLHAVPISTPTWSQNANTVFGFMGLPVAFAIMRSAP
jgi:hypothetical protein